MNIEQTIIQHSITIDISRYETADGTDVHEFVEKWDDSNSTVKGYIFITSNTNDSSQYYIVQLTGMGSPAASPVPNAGPGGTSLLQQMKTKPSTASGSSGSGASK